jgi:hypothetical protein
MAVTMWKYNFNEGIYAAGGQTVTCVTSLGLNGRLLVTSHLKVIKVHWLPCGVGGGLIRARCGKTRFSLA